MLVMWGNHQHLEKAMTVAELIEQLESFPAEMSVVRYVGGVSQCQDVEEVCYMDKFVGNPVIVVD